jgi:iron complex outermembrane receptor protein
MKDIVRTIQWICCIAAAPVAWSQASLADASLEDLLKVQVTSVSKKEQTLARTAASVYVIGADEIRRSGAQTMPDVLRLAPGVNVAQIDANAWAISIRGLNSRYSNKVLVLVDGRAVYNNTFGGVYWDQIDLPLETVERVEVVRGPGGTVWGANAVNGVINIITKSARQSSGVLVAQSAGSDGSTRSLVQQGGAAGNQGAYRTFASWSRFHSMDVLPGVDAGDGWNRLQAGFRGDWQLGGANGLTVEGNLFRNRGSQNRRDFFVDLPGATTFNEPVRSMGGNFLGRWAHTSASGAQTALQVYLDGYHRLDLGTTESFLAVDFDLQHHFSAGRHDVVASVGYRTLKTAIGTNGPITTNPPRRTDGLYSSSIQDEMRLADKVWLTVGSKFEHNSYTGFEFEPSLRVAWAPSPRQTLWAATAQAIRQPARTEAGVHVQIAAVPIGETTELLITLDGNPGVQSERLRDVETGYRGQWSRTVSLDASAFYGNYRGLLIPDDPPLAFGRSGDINLVLQRLVYRNLAAAQTYGGEASLTWTPVPRWRLTGEYANLHQTATGPAISGVPLPTENNAPRHAVQVRSSLNLARRIEWSQWFAGASRFAPAGIEGRLRVDTRLAWRPREDLEIGVTGQNLYRPGYIEFTDLTWIVSSRNSRRIFGNVAWTF